MKTIIFDLDGTLCDITHRLHHIKNGNKNWDTFHAECVNDVPKSAVVGLWFRIMYGASYYGDKMIIVSGRSDTVRNETLHWLRSQNIFPDELIMRPDGDYTPDDELKRKWLHEGKFGPKEDILFCVDDRQRVVDMWRAEGLICLQVAAWIEDNRNAC